MSETRQFEPTSMFYWWPRVKDLPVAMPATHLFWVGSDAMIGIFDHDWSGLEVIFPQIQAAAAQLGYPVFLRTDMCSGKHDWKNTCYVPEASVLAQHICAVIEDNELNGLYYNGIAVRQYIELESSFTAFWGELPISTERRYFVRDGVVLEHFPYWPAGAIQQASVDDWEERLAAQNYESPEEMRKLVGKAQVLSTALPGYWSLGFALAKDGQWYFIDAAEGEKSWRPGGA